MSDDATSDIDSDRSAIVGNLPDPEVNPDPEVEDSANKAMAGARGFSLSDALGEYARRLKRNVMLWSSLAILATYYEIKLTRVPWFEIELPESGAEITPLLLFVPLVYSLVSFVVQAWADLLVWQTRHDQGVFRYMFNILHRMNQYLYPITVEMKQLGSAQRKPIKLIDWTAQLQRIKAASKASKMAGETFCEAADRARRATRLKTFMAYGWEFALPATVGVLAVIYSAPPAWRAIVSLTQAAVLP